MVTPIAIRRVPEEFPGALIVNQNFQRLKATIERAVVDGTLVGDWVNLIGDVTGVTGSGGIGTTVEKIRNMNVPAPTSGENLKILRYVHASLAFEWVPGSPTTTQGDLIYRGASADSRLGIGSTHDLLAVASGLPAWKTLSFLLDNVFSSTQGSILYRGAATWAALGPSTSGYLLKTLGAGSNPTWAAPASGGTQTPGAVWGDANDAASVSVGDVVYVRLPYSGTITGWWLVADDSSTLEIEVWKKAGALPTAADKISATAPATLTTTTVNSDTTLTGWTTSLTAGDVLAFKLNSLTVGSPKQVALFLKVE